MKEIGRILKFVGLGIIVSQAFKISVVFGLGTSMFALGLIIWDSN